MFHRLKTFFTVILASFLVIGIASVVTIEGSPQEIFELFNSQEDVTFGFAERQDKNVDDDLSVGDNLTIGGNATTTGDLVILGGDLNKNGTALTIGAKLTVSGNATSSGFLVIGTTNPQNNMVAGDLLLGGNATTTGDVVISGGTFDLATSTPTTTPGLFIQTSATATSTLGIGDQSTGSGSNTRCIELVRSDGTYARAYVVTTTWVVEAGRCNDLNKHYV